MCDMAIDGDTTEGNEATARGDRAQRHRDVMDASSAVLEQCGWEGFSIRDVAARAGISAGAIYQWFSGKGEIWANLQCARFLEDVDVARGWSNDLSPTDTVDSVVGLISRNHAELGRYRFEFVRGLAGSAPQYSIDLTEAHLALNQVLAGHIERIQNFTQPPEDQAARISWVWAVGKGVGDHIIDGGFDVHGVTEEEFLATTARSVLAGLQSP